MIDSPPTQHGLAAGTVPERVRFNLRWVLRTR